MPRVLERRGIVENHPWILQYPHSMDRFLFAVREQHLVAIAVLSQIYTGL